MKAGFGAQKRANRIQSNGRRGDVAVYAAWNHELERRVAPLFIRGDDYGTRASTAVIINSARVEVLEQSYGPDGEVLDSAAANLSRVGHTAAGWST